MVWKPGKKLRGDRYTIERILGRGRSAITYLAYDKHKNRVVIKTLSDEIFLQYQQMPAEIDRLQDKLFQEAIKLEKCQHPHVVRCLGEPFRECDGNRKYVCVPMEYIAGVDLASLPKQQLSEAEALPYIRQIGEALVCVHSQGLLHLDVKPENILVRCKTGEAVLIDFDLARETDIPLSSRRQISDGFAPLELYLDSMKENIGAWTDVYSLAATLYFLVTGKIPPSSEQRQQDLSKHSLNLTKENYPHLSNRLLDAIIKGMNLECNSRPETMEIWLKSLEIYDRRQVWIDRLKSHWIVIAGIIGFLHWQVF